MSITQVVEQVSAVDVYDCHWVSLTGGEPLLQTEFIQKLLPILKSKGYKIYLETNGTLPEELKQIVRFIDLISMDIKLPTDCGEVLFNQHKEFLKIAKHKIFTKIVVDNHTKLSEFKTAIDSVFKYNHIYNLVLQLKSCLDGKPTGNVIDNKIFEMYNYAKDVIKGKVVILPQIHKMLNIR